MQSQSIAVYEQNVTLVATIGNREVESEIELFLRQQECFHSARGVSTYVDNAAEHARIEVVSGFSHVGEVCPRKRLLIQIELFACVD